MTEQENINNSNKLIRDLQYQVETLTLKCSHNGGSYNKRISYLIGHLRRQIYLIKLKRNEQIKIFYTNYNKYY
jgi:hypothetical protein